MSRGVLGLSGWPQSRSRVSLEGVAMVLCHDDVDLLRDKDLVERCQAGDARAFEDLFLRYFERLKRSCARKLGDPLEAEEIAQEAFAKAWRALPNLTGERRFYPWLSVIAANLCTDTRRRRQRVIPVAECDSGTLSGVEEAIEDDLDKAIALEAMSKLSPRHRKVLSLREGSGWSYQRIADHEGLKVSAVETVLWRARQALKREFAAMAGPEAGVRAVLIGTFAAFIRQLHRLRSRLGSAGVRGGVGPVMAGAAAAAVAVGSLGTLTSLGVIRTAPSNQQGGSAHAAAARSSAPHPGVGSLVVPGPGGISPATVTSSKGLPLVTAAAALQVPGLLGPAGSLALPLDANQALEVNQALGGGVVLQQVSSTASAEGQAITGAVTGAAQAAAGTLTNSVPVPTSSSTPPPASQPKPLQLPTAGIQPALPAVP